MQPRTPPVPDLIRITTDSLDVFKGLLVIIMTWSHVMLALMSPNEQFHLSFAHFVINAASSLCFLGFMLSYGFSCDFAYISDWKRRSPEERTTRMLRSASLPVMGAWCCAFGWGWMCFKLPMDIPTAGKMLSFWMAVGNGPDFLLAFTTCLLLMYTMRKLVNFGLENGARLRLACIAIMLLAPLAIARCIIPDCTGPKRYLGYLFECNVKDPWSPNLPSFPHLFYFNLGILLARSVRAI